MTQYRWCRREAEFECLGKGFQPHIAPMDGLLEKLKRRRLELLGTPLDLGAPSVAAKPGDSALLGSFEGLMNTALAGVYTHVRACESDDEPAEAQDPGLIIDDDLDDPEDTEGADKAQDAGQACEDEDEPGSPASGAQLCCSICYCTANDKHMIHIAQTLLQLALHVTLSLSASRVAAPSLVSCCKNTAASVQTVMKRLIGHHQTQGLAQARRQSAQSRPRSHPNCPASRRRRSARMRLSRCCRYTPFCEAFRSMASVSSMQLRDFSIKCKLSKFYCVTTWL